ncbi:MAG TPA: AbrB/MazE/SpoVT family DNA-binding domain-containing protein [Nevskiaceae bacterium]|nr:AbrB/MazE/SpoVT family DNA-binding domain-containing protein [Nevskiaceae bacterium]
MVFIVNIRDRRQITLPADVLNQLSLSVGDNLAIQVKEQKLVAKPVQKQAVDTLKAIQKIFQNSKVSEDELQKSGRKLRKKLSEKIYEG